LAYVKRLEPVDLIPKLAEKKTKRISKKSEELFYLDKQIKSLEGQLFAGQGINGRGVRVAIFDGGFPNVDKDTAFAHIRNSNRIKGTFDFTKDQSFVYYSNTHGTMVLSNIAGLYDGMPMGLATDAEFLLAKTEVGAEPFAEEEYWLAAVEWADKNGADIINSSLGYTHHRYFRDQMDGTSLVARAGNLAFSKGILVVNAAGNEGSTSFWKYIGTPADADSVLSIGGIDPSTDYHISFSSYGPTADGRMKPNVSAMGTALVISKNGPVVASGTSFASPLVAGFAACVLQMHPSYTVKEAFDEIQKSAHLYPYYDYAHGYGVPKASYFTNKHLANTLSTFRFEKIDNILKIKVLNHSNHPVGQKNYMYYHVSKANGFLKSYEVIDVYQQEALEIDLSDFEKGDVVRVHYQSFTNEYVIK
jgi:subtilisin family serine protease